MFRRNLIRGRNENGQVMLLFENLLRLMVLIIPARALAWTEVGQLYSSDSSAGDWLGMSVSISGEQAIAGARHDDDNGIDSGSAYVFRHDGSGWSETTKLTPSDGAAYDEFGKSVSISGDKAIVGARYDDDKGNDSGSAYIYEKVGGTWIETAKLTASDGSSSDYFGWSVSISGDQAIVGAYANDDGGYNSGSAYIYERVDGTWIQTAKLTAYDGASYNYYGWSVSISGDQAIVGSYGDDTPAQSSGSTYIYIRSPGVRGRWPQN